RGLNLTCTCSVTARVGRVTTRALASRLSILRSAVRCESAAVVFQLPHSNRNGGTVRPNWPLQFIGAASSSFCRDVEYDASSESWLPGENLRVSRPRTL